MKGKRLFDLLVSFIGLVILSPLFIVLGIIIISDTPGGVFFRGIRIGQYGKPFRIYKFRSMRKNSEGNGKWNVGDNDDRITKAGHFLRKSKLDEIPQLINVLKGEMSLVGPRPELKYYVDLYTAREKVILDSKPGITDWASIVNFEQFKQFTVAGDPDEFYLEKIRPLKIKLQIYYREHNNLFTDISCILWTLYKLVTHSEKLPKDIKKIVIRYKREQERKAGVKSKI